MAIKLTSPSTPQINLDGPEGNAYCLIGYANSYSKQLGFLKQKREQILEEMTSGNYFNLVKVFNQYFGEYVEIVTTNEELFNNILQN